MRHADMLTGGQVADCTAGAELLKRLPYFYPGL